MRYGLVWPVGPLLDRLLHPFLDEKDQGSLILTHIYLLFACASPLWIYSSHLHPILPYSGLLCIGVGDSMASIIGSLYGRHKWPEIKKSIEGTLANIIAVYVSALLLSWMIKPLSPFQVSSSCCSNRVTVLLDSPSCCAHNIDRTHGILHNSSG